MQSSSSCQAEILPGVPYEISVHLDWRFPWTFGEGSCCGNCVFKAQDRLHSLSLPRMYLYNLPTFPSHPLMDSSFWSAESLLQKLIVI